MSPILVIKRKMNTIKQLGKGTMFTKGPDNTQVFKNSNSTNFIKGVFDIDLHHNPIRV